MFTACSYSLHVAKQTLLQKIFLFSSAHLTCDIFLLSRKCLRARQWVGCEWDGEAVKVLGTPKRVLAVGTCIMLQEDLACFPPLRPELQLYYMGELSSYQHVAWFGMLQYVNKSRGWLNQKPHREREKCLMMQNTTITLDRNVSASFGLVLLLRKPIIKWHLINTVDESLQG